LIFVKHFPFPTPQGREAFKKRWEGEQQQQQQQQQPHIGCTRLLQTKIIVLG